MLLLKALGVYFCTSSHSSYQSVYTLLKYVKNLKKKTSETWARSLSWSWVKRKWNAVNFKRFVNVIAAGVDQGSSSSCAGRICRLPTHILLYLKCLPCLMNRAKLFALPLRCCGFFFFFRFAQQFHYLRGKDFVSENFSE